MARSPKAPKAATVTVDAVAEKIAAVRKAAKVAPLKADALPLENAVAGQSPAKGKAAAPSALTAVPAQWNAAERNLVAAVQGGNKAFAAEVAALKAAAVDGKACKTYATLYKAVCVAAELGYPEGDAGVVMALALHLSTEKKTDAEQTAMANARNRLSRRLKAAGIEAANASGRKRGARVTGGKGKGKGKTLNAPAPAAPAPAAPVDKAAPPVMAPKTARAPMIANEVEFGAHLHDLAAYLRTCQSKNAKAATARVRKAIAAFLSAEAELAKALAENAPKA